MPVGAFVCDYRLAGRHGGGGGGAGRVARARLSGDAGVHRADLRGVGEPNENRKQGFRPGAAGRDLGRG